MSDDPKDGGAAFPMPAAEHSLGGHHEQHGMSMRDWFAGQALVGILSNANGVRSEEDAEKLAPACYTMADAMLAARKEQL